MKKRKYLLIANKIDLGKRMIFPNSIPKKNIIYISAGLNSIKELEIRIIGDFLEESSSENSYYPFLTSP